MPRLDLWTRLCNFLEDYSDGFYTISIRANVGLEIALHCGCERFFFRPWSKRPPEARVMQTSSITALKSSLSSPADPFLKCFFSSFFVWQHCGQNDAFSNYITHAITTILKSLDSHQLWWRWAADLSSNATCTSLAPFNKPLWMRSHSSDPGALLPCNHVLLCMATFVISRWQPDVGRKQFYLMDGHKRGRGYISFMPRRWIMHNINRLPSQIYSKSVFYRLWVTIARTVRTFQLVVMRMRPTHYHTIYLSS